MFAVSFLFSYVLIRLEDGEILDKKVFRNDFVNPAHNMGAFLYDDLLAIVSLRYQTIHILQIRESGNLVDVRAIGTFCSEDDELFLNSSTQASGIFLNLFIGFQIAPGTFISVYSKIC